MPTLTLRSLLPSTPPSKLSSSTMVKSIRSSSYSPRRSSRTGSTPSGQSKDETALNVLRDNVLERGFYSIKDPNNVMMRIWVRADKDHDDDGEGKDWVREDGFTVQKYKEFWQSEMKDEDEAIVEWGDRLPQEAWEHLSKKLVKEIESKIVVVEEDEEEDAKATAPAPVSAKKKKTSPNANSTKKKTNKKQKVSNGYDSDELGEDLQETRDELNSLLESGRAKINAPEVNKTTSRAKAKARALAVQAMFEHNLGKSAEASEYKKNKLDPVAKRALAQIDEHVAGLAAETRNEMIGAMGLTNYKFSESKEEEDSFDALIEDIGKDTAAEEKVSDDDNVATEEGKSSEDNEKSSDEGGDKISDEE